MFGRTPTALRALAVAAAVALGASVASPAFAQDVAPPEGLVDGAQATFSNEDDLSQFIFSVFQFEDEASAEAGLDAVLEVANTSLGETESDEAPTELTDVEGLDSLGDEARAYGLNFTEGVDITYIVVLDGVYIHYWAYVGADISDLTGTPEADSTPAADSTPGAGGAPVDELVSIATAVLGEGAADGAALGDLLPTVDDLPEGYTETSRQESLNGGALAA